MLVETEMGSRKKGSAGPSPVVTREELAWLHRQMVRLAPTSNTAYSLTCSLGSMLGNWPRVKRATWVRVCDECVRFLDAHAREPQSQAKPVQRAAACELCLAAAKELHVTPEGYSVCTPCAKQFWGRQK